MRNSPAAAGLFFYSHETRSQSWHALAMHADSSHQMVRLVPLEGKPPATLRLQTLGSTFAIHCHAGSSYQLALRTAFAGLIVGSSENTTMNKEHEYFVEESGGKLMLASNGVTEQANDLGDLLYLIDKKITLALQSVRTDLLFLHGGALLARDGRVIVVTASSGSGKSTLTWALLHHGFGYLSDELAPVDLQTLNVQAYPHALCVKKRPPEPYVLPPETLETSRSLHVPVEPCTSTGSLASIFFVDHRHPPGHPILTQVGAARAALRLYPNTLNPLAHANDGLDAVAEITRQVPCYELNSANLPAACKAMATLLG